MMPALPLPALPLPGESVKVDLAVLPEYLAKHGMHIREVTKDLIVILEAKEQEHDE